MEKATLSQLKATTILTGMRVLAETQKGELRMYGLFGNMQAQPGQREAHPRNLEASPRRL